MYGMEIHLSRRTYDPFTLIFLLFYALPYLHGIATR